MSTKVSPPFAEPVCDSVVPLNEQAAVYLLLASEIAGTAVGLSSDGQALLRSGLVDRFSEVFVAHGEEAIDNLLRLATAPQAA